MDNTNFYNAITNMVKDAEIFLSREHYKKLILDLCDILEHMRQRVN